MCKRISAAAPWKVDSSQIRLFVRDRSYMQAEHGECVEMLCCLGCRSSHSFYSRSFVHTQGQARLGWINLCFPSWQTSLFWCTLKMKLMLDTPSLTAVKGNDAKNIPPLLSLPLSTVSPCLGADKSYLSYSLHSVSDRRLVSSEKMKCKFY